MEIKINTNEKRINVIGEVNAKRLLQIMEVLGVDENWTVGSQEVINIPYQRWDWDYQPYDWRPVTAPTVTYGENSSFSSCLNVN
jgi:hypothetical protein